MGVFSRLWASMTRFSDMLNDLAATGEEINAGVRQRSGLASLPPKQVETESLPATAAEGRKSKARVS